ncbi:Transposase IS66 [Nostoc sphaeroides CCNUC1]|uniref:Transposase IS66 n=1 Tax=Nostoc sphaeroides CCNUC1 TaxID=2653204 RepID=A0A5P8WKX9_9NOSO|nr:Transposase IS66 [Nostoc sphaeroides CCNUC1]
MNQSLPQDLDRESLNQLSKEELVEIIIEQSKVIRTVDRKVLEFDEKMRVSTVVFGTGNHHQLRSL